MTDEPTAEAADALPLGDEVAEEAIEDADDEPAGASPTDEVEAADEVRRGRRVDEAGDEEAEDEESEEDPLEAFRREL